MNRIILFSLMLVLGCTHKSAAQKQANVWVFPNNNILSFNTEPPIFSNGGMISCSNGAACEGVASLSDSSGNLLFYSNGVNVWGSDHGIILNGSGLMGHPSSTQSVFILPIPGEQSRYYLFTTDAYENQLQNGLRYSLLSLCGANNQPIIETKNILLRSNVTEKLCVTQHNNGSDYWLVAHEHASSKFLIYLISNNGIELIDSTSIGMSHPPILAGAVGQMKFSPNGNRLVLTVSNTNNSNPGIELFDFDKNIGSISNPVFFNPDTLGGYPSPFYGLSFSPDGSKLYAAPAYWERIYQIDLTQGNTSLDLVNASMLLNSVFNSQFAIAQIQLAPNGKIYLAKNNSMYLDVILNPNEVGVACNYQSNFISLANNTSSWGLPAFIDNFNYSASGVCLPTGIDENLDNPESTIYPNPANDYITLQQTEPNNLRYQVFDIAGRQLISADFNGTTTISTKEFSNGVYLVEVFLDKEIIATEKFVVQHE